MKENKVDKKFDIKNFLGKYFLLIAILLIYFYFSLEEPAFRQINNILDIFRSASIIGLMGIGITYSLMSGEFDLSIGAAATLSAIIVGRLLAYPNFNNFLLAMFIALVIACIIGLFNAFNTLVIGVPSFIATLGSLTLLNGVTKYITGGGVFYSLNWPPTFLLLGQGMIGKIIPTPTIVFLLVFLFAWNHTERTKTGSYIFAVGANPVACLHIGISVKKSKTLAFVFSSFFAGFAGIIQGSTLGSITPGMGDGNLLPAISAAMLGATFLKPGIHNMPGSVMGAILLAIIANGLTMVGASFFMKDVIQGVILLVAVGIIAKIGEESLTEIKIS